MAFDPSMLGSLGNQPPVRSLLQMLGWQDPNAGGSRGAAPVGGGAGSGGGAPVGGGGDGGGGPPSPSGGGAPPENQQVLDYIRGLQGSDSLSSMANPFLRAASAPGMSGYFQYDPNQGGVVPRLQAPGTPGGMTQEDMRESPLAYNSEERPYEPRDTGGWFTIGQQYDFAPGGGRSGAPQTDGIRAEPGQNVPQLMSGGRGNLSTNNWRLLGMGPGWIMRNGALIKPSTGDRGFASGANPGGGVTAEHTVISPFIATGTGAYYGYPNLFAPGYAPPKAGWPSAEISSWMPIMSGNYG